MSDIIEQERLESCEASGVLDAYEGRPCSPHPLTGAYAYAYMAGYWHEAALGYKAACVHNGELYHLALDALSPDDRQSIMHEAAQRQ